MMYVSTFRKDFQLKLLEGCGRISSFKTVSYFTNKEMALLCEDVSEGSPSEISRHIFYNFTSLVQYM